MFLYSARTSTRAERPLRPLSLSAAHTPCRLTWPHSLILSPTPSLSSSAVSLTQSLPPPPPTCTVPCHFFPRCTSFFSFSATPLVCVPLAPLLKSHIHKRRPSLCVPPHLARRLNPSFHFSALLEPPPGLQPLLLHPDPVTCFVGALWLPFGLFMVFLLEYNWIMNLVGGSPEESSLGNQNHNQNNLHLNVSPVISAELLQRSTLLYILAVVGSNFPILYKPVLLNQEL